MVVLKDGDIIVHVLQIISVGCSIFRISIRVTQSCARVKALFSAFTGRWYGNDVHVGLLSEEQKAVQK